MRAGTPRQPLVDTLRSGWREAGEPRDHERRACRGAADASYLYRATASASGYDGPDLARFPGGSVTASLAGDRTAWLERAGARHWLVEGAVVPVLERG
ncbi:hypothetical protein J2S48_000035 [Promicromonospora iranensis]|uniref:Uncharacterized protein n=1 Tax=Promicromonospora iranensis TaxID=1105144 RepID=A0ABU2CGR4_9MICO|nr:hypothetical protein [Promicromonospora iranensis]